MKRLRLLAFGGIAFAALAIALVAALGARRGELTYAAFDGVFAIDLDRGRVHARNEMPEGVRGLSRPLAWGGNPSLWVAAENGLHELDAETLETRRTIARGIYDAVDRAPGLSAGEIVALEHPGHNPKEARSFHFLRHLDVSGEEVRELGRWKLPPDAHDLVIFPNDAVRIVFAPRQVGARVERIDLSRPDLDSNTVELRSATTLADQVMIKTMVPGAGVIYAFEGRLEGASSNGEPRFHLLEIASDGTVARRTPLPDLPGYPRHATLTRHRPGLALSCGREIVLLDLPDGAVRLRIPMEERSFASLSDSSGHRLIVVRPTHEATRGAALILDAVTGTRRNALSLPAPVSELCR